MSQLSATDKKRLRAMLSYPGFNPVMEEIIVVLGEQERWRLHESSRQSAAAEQTRNFALAVRTAIEIGNLKNRPTNPLK